MLSSIPGLARRTALAISCSALLAFVVGCGSPDQVSTVPAAEAPTPASEPKKESPARSEPPASEAPAAAAAFVRTGGTFDKLTLEPTDAFAFIHPVADGSKGVKSRLLIMAADRSGLCTTGPTRQGSTVFFIDALSGEATFQPGTFTQKMDSVPGQVDIGASKLGPTCNAIGQDYGASEATVVVTQITKTTVSGTFDVTLMNGEGTLKGTFDVPICGQAPAMACQP